MARPLNVLHVDDQAEIRQVFALAGAFDPHLTLRQAASGQEALDLLAAGVRPDVVLLDVMMPILDGPDVLARMQGMAGVERTPVIFTTGRAHPAEVRRLRALGAVGVIAKPVDLTDLWRQVRDLSAAAVGP